MKSVVKLVGDRPRQGRKRGNLGKERIGYVNYRHFEAVIAKAKTACINSGQQVADHFVGSDQMIEIGSGAQRPLKTVMMSRSFQLKFRSGDGNGIGDQLVQAFAACFGLERRRLM